MRALVGSGKTEEAIRECQQWAEERPDSRSAVWRLTELETARDGLDAVRTRMRRLARLPDMPSVYGEVYASLCLKAGDPERALEEYTRLCKHSSDTRHQRGRAFALSKCGRYEQAATLMAELLGILPADDYLCTAFVAACRRAGQVNRAVDVLTRLAAAHPESRVVAQALRRAEGMSAAISRRAGSPAPPIETHPRP